MKLPIEVSFRRIPPSAWIEADILKRAARLDKCHPDIMSCRVVVDVPHRHHEQGNRFRVRIDLTVPGDEIAVSRESTLYRSRKDLGAGEWAKQFEIEGMRKDLRLVLREAFDIARRQLQDSWRRQRRAVKTHEAPPRGRAAGWSSGRPRIGTA